MVVGNVSDARHLAFSDTFFYPIAAGMEWATSRALEWAGNIPFNRNQSIFHCPGDFWDGLK